MRHQAGGVGRPCAAALDADALDAILRNETKWDGVRALMRDVWRGHKEDPRKVRLADLDDMFLNATSSKSMGAWQREGVACCLGGSLAETHASAGLEAQAGVHPAGRRHEPWLGLSIKLSQLTGLR